MLRVPNYSYPILKFGETVGEYGKRMRQMSDSELQDDIHVRGADIRLNKDKPVDEGGPSLQDMIKRRNAQGEQARRKNN